MKRKVCVLISLLLVCCMVVLTGCSGGSDNTDKANTMVETAFTLPLEGVEEFGEDDTAYINAMNKIFGDLVAADKIEFFGFSQDVFTLQVEASKAEAKIAVKSYECKKMEQENLYEYTADLDISMANGETTTVSIGGSMQFNEDGMVDYMSIDKGKIMDVLKLLNPELYGK